MTLGALVALAATFAVFALTPGPAVTAIVARAITDGAKPALALNAGVVTGELLFLGLAAAGMAAAAKSMSELFTVLRWLGAIYLLWQGVALWRTRPRVAVSIDAAGHETHFWRNFGAGLLLMFGHVQAILFYAALLPGFVDLANLAAAELGVIAVLQLVIVGGANAAYALLAAQARGFFANERAQRALHRVAAAMMFVAAALVATRV
ncbi:MAG TPA: LysE family translocator [Steroidobacteraceae bacterium]